MTDPRQREINCDRRSALKSLGVFVVGSLSPSLSLAAEDEKTRAKPSADAEINKTPSKPADVGLNANRLNRVVKFLDEEVAAGSIPGCGVAASRDGHLVLEAYRGTFASAAGDRRPFASDISSMLFSFSKGVSATVTVMTQQDGLLDYDKPVAAYIPEFAASGKESITLRQILTHSAGIPNIPLLPLGTDDRWDAGVKAMSDWKPEWLADSKTAYHGLGMFIVAEAVRRVSGGKPWREICRERLFKPLDAASMTFGIPEDKSLTSLTPGYVESLDSEQCHFIGHPAGGCFGTIRDALKVLELHLSAGVWHNQQLLQPQALTEMHTVRFEKNIADAIKRGDMPAHDPWGLGWLLRGTGPSTGTHAWFGFRDQKSPKIFGHAGIDTVIGVADPVSRLAFMFVTTASPKSSEETIRLRNEVTNRLFASLETK